MVKDVSVYKIVLFAISCIVYKYLYFLFSPKVFINKIQSSVFFYLNAGSTNWNGLKVLDHWSKLESENSKGQ